MLRIQPLAERSDKLSIEVLKMRMGGLEESFFKKLCVAGTEPKLGHLESQHSHKIRYPRDGGQRKNLKAGCRDNGGDELILDDEIFDERRILMQTLRDIFE